MGKTLGISTYHYTDQKMAVKNGCFFRQSRQLVEETTEKVLQGKAQTDGQKFNFMAFLLSKKELTKEDVFILALSLFGDGLNTVSLLFFFGSYGLQYRGKGWRHLDRGKRACIRELPHQSTLHLL